MSTLSFKKLVTLIQKNSYLISSVWTTKGDVQLLELRSPKLQRTFLVNVPSKYKLVCDVDTYKNIKINPTTITPTQKQLDYLNEIKGSILVCDLASISSRFICIYRNNGDVAHYVIGEEDEEVKVEEQDDLSDLISRATKVIEIHGEKVLLPNSSEDIEEVKMMDDEEIIEPREDPEQIVELEFVEDSEEEESESEEVVPWSENVAKPSKTSLNYRKDNSIPPNLGDLDIMRGIVYYCISLSDLYKKAGNIDFETEIVTVYDVLNENDKSVREGRFENISVLVPELVKKVRTEIDLYDKIETDIKESILSLSFLLDKAEGLRETKGGPELEKIYTQTRAAIYDANIDLLRKKEAIDDFLESVEHSIEEYIKESVY